MSLRTYLASRRVEVEAHIKSLKKELQEIRIAEAALDGVASGAASSQSAGDGPRQGTIKEWVLKVLEGAQDGMETDAVIEAVKGVGGPSVPRSSMTPQLSRLKHNGDITQIGRNWMLPKYNVAILRPGIDIDEDWDELLGITPTPAVETTKSNPFEDEEEALA